MCVCIFIEKKNEKRGSSICNQDMLEEQVLTGSGQFAEPVSHTSCDNGVWRLSHKAHPENVITPRLWLLVLAAMPHVQTSIINPENPLKA